MGSTVTEHAPDREGTSDDVGSATDEDRSYDLVVIGAGIIGSGIARDAVLRGARVALVEMHDLAWGTTARSTRLVHGGLRYLEHYDFGLVREALRERKTLIDIAPHLVHPLPLLLPKIRGRGRPRWMLRTGLFLYDGLARRNIGTPHRWLPRAAVVRSVPALDRPDLQGAFAFFDAQVSFPERVVVENAVDVEEHGGAVMTHAEVVGLDHLAGPVPDGRRHVVRVKERNSDRTHELRTRLVINTAGPWVTQVDSRLGSAAPALTRRTKGVHLLTDPITERALLVQCSDGERIFFVIPWEGYSLIGTTDTDYAGSNEEVYATPEDVRYLLDEVNTNLDLSLRPEDVHATYAGLRPLIHKPGGTAGAVSRRHLIEDHDAHEGPRGLVTVVGGKITSFRAIAEDVVDHTIDRILGGPGPRSSTADRPLPGGRSYDDVALRRRLGAELPHLTDDDVDRLLALYGARASAIADVAARPGVRVGHIHASSRLTWEEARFVVEAEHARGVEDVLMRRTMAGWAKDGAVDVAPLLAKEMARWRDWPEGRAEAEVEAYLRMVDRNREGARALVGVYEPRRADPRLGKVNVRRDRASRRWWRRKQP